MRMPNYNRAVISSYIIFKMITQSLQTNVQVCDENIESILAAQNITYSCDSNNRIIIDGVSQNRSLDLVLQNMETSINEIIFMNFKNITFNTITISGLDRQNQISPPLLNMMNNEFVSINNIQIQCEKEINIRYLILSNNKKVIIDDLIISFDNGYSPIIEPLEQQMIISLESNNSTEINNYQFLYAQCNEGLDEYNDIVGVFSQNNDLVISSVLIEIKYLKKAFLSSFGILISPLYHLNNNNIIHIQSIDIILSAIKSLYGFSQRIALIQFGCQNEYAVQCGDIQIDQLYVSNQNFVINILNASSQKSLSIRNAYIKETVFEPINLLNQINGVKSMISFSQQLDSLIIKELQVIGSFNHQFYYVLYFQCDTQNSVINIDSFNITNSFWKNSMIYVYNNANNTLNIFLSMKNSVYKGVNPLLFMKSEYIILKLDIDIQENIEIQKSLIQTYRNTLFRIKDSRFIIGQSVESIQLGKGGIIQVILTERLEVEGFIFECYSNSTFKSQIGGMFQTHQTKNIYFNDIHASGFSIDGSGSFAYIFDANNVGVESSAFDSFSSAMAGGTMLINYNGNLTLKNVNVSNSHAGIIGGGLYLASLNHNSDSIELEDVTIINSYAPLGCALVMTGDKNKNKIKIFQNPQNICSEQNIIDEPITNITISQYGQYNPLLSEEQKFVNLSLTYTKNEIRIYFNLDDFEINIMHFLKYELVVGKNKTVSYNDLNNIICDKKTFQQIQQYENNNITHLKQTKNCSDNIIPFNQYYQYFTQISDPYYYDPNAALLDDMFKPGVSFFSEDKINEFHDFYIIIQVNKTFQGEIQTFVFGTPYTFRLIQIDSCLTGQVRKNGTKICQYCYDFKSIKQSNQTQCFSCSPTQFDQCSGNTNKLSPGWYYKFLPVLSNQSSNNTSNVQEFDLKKTIIFECTYPENCIGGIQDGDFLCVEAHIGPLCLECDRYQQHWNANLTSTRSNSQECEICSSYSSNLTLTILFFIGLFWFIAFLDFLLFLQFKNITKNVELKKRVSTTVHLKIILFFAQISNVCSFYRSPKILKSLFKLEIYIYNPFTNSFLNFFECFLIQHFPKKNAPHLMVSIQAILPLCIIFGYILLRILIKYIYNYKNSKQGERNESLVSIYLNNKSFFIQITLYSINTFNFQIIQGLISGVFCQSWVQLGNFSSLDLTVLCNDPNRLDYLHYIFIPMLTIYAVVFPSLLYYLLLRKRKQKKQDQEHNRFMIGFLYQDYKDKFYYWEIVRFVVKVLITVGAQPQVNNTNIVGYSVISVLIVYLIVLVICKPYVLDKGKYLKYKFFNFEFQFDYTQREALMIISGILLISCYVINTVSYQNSYYTAQDTFPLTLIAFGHLQSIILLCLMIYIFIKYLVVIKVQSWYIQRQSRQSQETQQTD